MAVFCITASWSQVGRRLRQRPALWVWLLYYAWHAASYFWSPDRGAARFDLESKLSLLVLPVIVGARGIADRRSVQAVSAAFVCGVLATGLFCLGQALWRYDHGAPSTVFFYHDLVSGLEANAVYNAWYAFFALSSLLLGFARVGPLTRWPVRWIATGILFLYFGLLSSRTLFVLFFILPLPAMLYSRWRAGTLRGLRLAAACLLAASVPLVVLCTPNPLRQRFEDVGRTGVAEAFLPKYQGEQDRFSNLTVRLLLWRVGWENMQRAHLWARGTGAGGVYAVQNERMRELGLIPPQGATQEHNSFENVNLHNMTLQSLVMLGVPGCLLFLILSVQPMVAALRSRTQDGIWFVFFCTAFVFMLQEAALQTQAGIIFYAFFAAFFWDYYYTRQLQIRPVHRM